MPLVYRKTSILPNPLIEHVLYTFFFFFEGTTTYENGDVTVTVTTSEITPEEIEHPREKSAEPLPPLSIGGAGKRHNIRITKKKPFKKATKGKSRPKLRTKRDRRKGKKNDKKRH